MLQWNVSCLHFFAKFGIYTCFEESSELKSLLLEVFMKRNFISNCIPNVRYLQECGRPLGLKIVDERKLLIVDSYHGLVEVDLQSQTQKDLLKTGPRSPYKFLNAVAVDDTSIYLTHSSSRHQRQEFPKIGIYQSCIWKFGCVICSFGCAGGEKFQW